MSHRIRLSARWKLRRDGTETLIDLPATFPPPSHVELSRAFGKPTNLQPDERVWLWFEEIEGEWSVAVNGSRMDGFQPGKVEWDVSDLMHERNEIRIVLNGESRLGNVFIEIR